LGKGDLDLLEMAWTQPMSSHDFIIVPSGFDILKHSLRQL
jgi:hypothetical protein